jgi:hypothetical protein
VEQNDSHFNADRQPKLGMPPREIIDIIEEINELKISAFFSL